MQINYKYDRHLLFIIKIYLKHTSTAIFFIIMALISSNKNTPFLIKDSSFAKVENINKMMRIEVKKKEAKIGRI